MNCDDARALLSDHVDRLLLPNEAMPLERHLERCDDCRHEQALLGSLVSTLEGLEDPEVPDEFTARVMAELPERLPAQEGAGHVLRWGLVCAAVFSAFVVGLALLPKLGGAEVARDTLRPLGASFELGGLLLAHAAVAMAATLDRAASFLTSLSWVHAAGFGMLFVGANLALMTALRRYRECSQPAMLTWT
ncbi:MAG: zf-HC2 domain-containing protein [Acidobacteriota bacterium]